MLECVRCWSVCDLGVNEMLECMRCWSVCD